MKNKIWIIMLYIVGYGYFLPMIGFAIYYNWKYSQEHSFGESLFYGRVLSDARAVVWPYFCFFNSNKKEPENRVSETTYDHYAKSAVYFMDASKKLDKKAILLAEPEDLTIYKDYIGVMKKAYEEGLKVNIDTLNFDKHNLGNVFRDEYLRGIQLEIHGFNNNLPAEFHQGADSIVQWLEHDWEFEQTK